MSEPESSRPPIAAAALSVFLTVPDGGPCLKEALAAWENFLAKLGRDYEILLVHDGTASVAERPRLRTLRPVGMPGIGAALRAGLAAARYPLFVCASGDPHYRPEDLKRLLERIDAVDLVVGCRTRPAPSWLRSIGWLYRGSVRVLIGVPLEPLPSWLGWKHWLFHCLLRVATGVRLHDVNCGLQLFRREFVAGIPVQANGPFALAEIIAKANFLGCLMDEVSVAGPAEAGSLWSLLAEGYRVLAHAEFGSPSDFVKGPAATDE